jgi:CDP-diacylglycerol--serine O-phosphatidyltransferase
MKKHIPNILTCTHLLSGCIGIVLAFNSAFFIYSCYAIFISAILDFCDGLAARALKANSEIGKELDSLADIVSFGVLPSVIVYQLFLNAPQLGHISIYLNYSAFLIAIASALRLAKFNIDTRQSENFIGLPTPANALVIASLPMIISQGNRFLTDYILNAYFLFIFTIGMSLLLVMQFPLISLKFRNLNLNDNLYRYILLFTGLILIFIFKFVAAPIILFLYIFLSIIQFRTIK